MVSSKRRLGDKMRKLDAEYGQFQSHVYQNIGSRSRLRNTGKKYRDTLAIFAHNQRIADANISNKDFFKDYMDIHTQKVLSCIQSLNSQIRLREVEPLDRKSFFEHKLMSAGMTVNDLRDVVDAHKQTVEEYFSMEEMNLPQANVNTSDRVLYEDIARRHKTDLDDLASQMFQRRIHTKLDVDVKENNPHQWLGWINIGYESRLPKLVALIAHEGPFGHQTHQAFSTEYLFSNPEFGLTSEGLAVLGEIIGVTNYFNTPQAAEISQFEHVSRRIGDTLNAGIAYLSYYEGKSAAEMAELLATDYYPRDALEAGLAAHDQDTMRRLRDPMLLGYYVGFNKVNEIYRNAREKIMNNPEIQSEDEKTQHHSGLLQTMFTGFRTPEVMKMEVNLFLKKRHLDNGTRPELPNVYIEKAHF